MTPTVGLNLDFRGYVTEVSARNPLVYLRETPTAARNRRVERIGLEARLDPLYERLTLKELPDDIDKNGWQAIRTAEHRVRSRTEDSRQVDWRLTVHCQTEGREPLQARLDHGLPSILDPIAPFILVHIVRLAVG
jgi:hypothetical protein